MSAGAIFVIEAMAIAIPDRYLMPRVIRGLNKQNLFDPSSDYQLQATTELIQRTMYPRIQATKYALHRVWQTNTAH